MAIKHPLSTMVDGVTITVDPLSGKASAANGLARESFSYNASRTCDCAATQRFEQSDTLAGDITITLTNLGATSRPVRIRTKQDATGGRVVTFAASGRTLYIPSGQGQNFADTQAANTVTLWEIDPVGTDTFVLRYEILEALVS